MKKILVLAALIGGMVTAAPLPAMADTVVPAHCAILPLLKAECRDAISAAANDAGKVTVVATGKVGNTVAGAVADAVPDSIDNGWRCERTPGGKALFACSR